MNVEVKIEGLDQMRSAFSRSPRLFTQIFDKAIKKSIVTLLGTSRSVTPVDTGFLRGPGMKTTFEVLVGKVENVAPYAVYVHEGTSKMEARPFFAWGVDMAQQQVNESFDDALAEFDKSLAS